MKQTRSISSLITTSIFLNDFLLFFQGGSDSSENRGEFLEKLQRARGAVRPATNTNPLFTKTTEDLVITVGNWNLSCKKDGELSIVNSDGQQQVIEQKNDEKRG